MNRTPSRPPGGAGAPVPPLTDAERQALDTAFELAAGSPAGGPNPRVGCVLLNGAGDVIGRGLHRGASHPHAEIEALRDARAQGLDVTGASAVVTLEPCAHTGRTEPCAQALIEAGIGRVVYAMTDPNPEARGGADILRAAGVEVVAQAAPERAQDLNEAWIHAVTTGRPYVTLKLATTLDGRIAAPDGTSQWITSEAARHHAHAKRAEVDAIVVGTGTVLADDPALTARLADGTLATRQPFRVVMGRRDIPEGARLRGPGGRLTQLRTHHPAEVLDALTQYEIRHVLVEGGAQVAGAFLRAGMVDGLDAYVQPMVLGAGTPAVPDLGIGTLGEAVEWQARSVALLGGTVYIRAARPKGEV